MLRSQLISAIRFVLLSALGLAAASAQTPDNSGNALLKGAFNFRHVAVQAVDNNNNPTDITAVYGTITFDGAGNYTMKGTSVDHTVAGGAPQTLNQSGTYAIGSNGLGYVTNELFPNDPNLVIYGSVAQGVFSGSSTESQLSSNTLNDVFVAIAAPATAPTNAGFTTPYQTGVLDFPGSTSSAVKNALFELVPDGKGNFGTITVTGQSADVQVASGAALQQTVSGATYNFNSDGSATLTIPAPSGVSSGVMFTGTKTMFESADGNFILGWTATGYDIFFGVKALGGGATNMLTQGLYFTSALENAPTFFGTDSYYGGTYNTGDANGDGIVHQRLNVPGFLSEDYGTDNQFSVNPDGSSNGSDFNFYQYEFGVAGQAFVAIGTQGDYALLVGTHVPTFNPTGSVFLNPTGVLNAASFQPVTASLSPGEVIALYGSGLSAGTMNIQGGQAFPTTLNNVQVTIDGIACPLYFVSPTQISALVPFEVATNQTGLANIQVTNNNVQSNVVQVYLTDSSPGSFAQTQNGLGLAAALHASTNQLITSSNPAKAGEYISLYLTGLGTVTPTIADGAIGPSNPLSYSDLYKAGNLAVYFNDYGPQGSTGNQGNIQFAGLVPTLAGLYQINVQVPSSGLAAGDNVYVEFVTDAADVNQIQIPFGAGSSARPASAARPSRAQRLQTMRSHPQNRATHKARTTALQ